MSAARAAPEGGTSGHGKINGDASKSTRFPAAVAPALIDRLAGHGIRTLQDWHRLTRKQRRELWGITAAMVATIDAAIAQVSR